MKNPFFVRVCVCVCLYVAALNNSWETTKRDLSTWVQKHFFSVVFERKKYRDEILLDLLSYRCAHMAVLSRIGFGGRKKNGTV